MTINYCGIVKGMLQDFSGPKLKSLRKRARLSQQQVIELTGVSEPTLCYLEHGRRRPQTQTLEKLLSLYAVRIQYFQNLDKVFEEKPLQSKEVTRNG